ncbi:MAG: formyltetrahydrofolate deformylase [Gammaproteobacteria bacterium]|nr:formyltetrahydrofolate deformylase [Gammaproteobacteria bacterium]
MPAQPNSPSDIPRYVLTLSCPDRTGIVAAVTGFLARHRANLVDASHFNDEDTRTSFVRALFHDDGSGMPSIDELGQQFAPLAQQFEMQWRFHPEAQPCRTLIAVSTAGHCLSSMLHRWSIGALPIEVVGVVSNHRTLEAQANYHNVPFHHLPITDAGQRAQEAQLQSLCESLDVGLLVLARYMRILSPEFCRTLRGHAINIHHSFLPGFKGARPYHQAYERGVKLIGATAHFVTDELDEGPIIEQAVERVDHTFTPEKLIDVGRDLESLVLNRAVKWYAEHRVFENATKTVVLK